MTVNIDDFDESCQQELQRRMQDTLFNTLFQFVNTSQERKDQLLLDDSRKGERFDMLVRSFSVDEFCQLAQDAMNKTFQNLRDNMKDVFPRSTMMSIQALHRGQVFVQANQRLTCPCVKYCPILLPTRKRKRNKKRRWWKRNKKRRRWKRRMKKMKERDQKSASSSPSAPGKETTSDLANKFLWFSEERSPATIFWTRLRFSEEERKRQTQEV